MKNRQGFSLVEVVAAVAVVGVSIVAVMSMFGLSGRSYKSQEERVIAANLLQRKIEEIKAMDYSTNFSASGFTYPAYPGYQLDIAESIYDPATEGLNLKKIDVRIRWNSVLGAQAEEIIRFLKAKR